MITVSLPMQELIELEKATRAAARKLPNEVAIAVNKTATQARTHISKDIREELNAKKPAVDKSLQKGKRATRSSTGTTVTVVKARRIPLKEFAARQTKAGTSYRISKRRGRSSVQGAFMGPKPGAISTRLGGHVYKRVGPNRLPIRRLMGPSPWGVFRGQSLTRPTKKQIAKNLRTNMQRRIRFNVLKASGAI